MLSNSDVDVRILAAVTKADGSVHDLGVITSPHSNRLLNWLWKRRKGQEIRKQLKGQS